MKTSKKSMLLAFVLVLGLLISGCQGDVAPEETPVSPEAPVVETPAGVETPEEVEDETPYGLTNISVADIQELFAENEDMVHINMAFLGKDAPEIELITLDGGTANLSDLFGQPFILEFMASWCPACEGVKPTLVEYGVREGSVPIISIAVFDEKDAVLAFAGEHAENYYLPMNSTDMTEEYLLNFVPIFFFIDESGVIQLIYSGDITAGILMEYTRKAFAYTELTDPEAVDIDEGNEE